MIEFVWPYMILFFPVPIIIRYIVYRKDNKIGGDRLKIPFFYDLLKMGYKEGKYYQPKILQLLILLAAWGLLVIAAMRPIKIADSWSIDVEGRDMMIAIDTSGSMERPEILDGETTTRLGVVVAITKELIKNRKGDRVGLVVYGSKAFLYSPLSFDLSLVSTFLEEVYAGMAGPKTAIGDALALSVKYLSDRPTGNRVLLFMTDGVNQSGRYTPEQGLEFAVAAGVTIYPIGIGFSNNSGNETTVELEKDLDETFLTEMAEKTNGEYFRISSADDLKNVFTYINQLEKINESLIRQSVDEIYFIYIWWAVCLLMLLFVLQVYTVYSVSKVDEGMKNNG